MVSMINASEVNKLPNHVKQKLSNICPDWPSVTGHDLDVKGSIYLTRLKDNRNFPTQFIICKNFPYQAIIGAIFLKPIKY